MTKKITLALSLFCISVILTASPRPVSAIEATPSNYCNFNGPLNQSTNLHDATGDVTIANNCVIFEDINGPAQGNLTIDPGATMTLYRKMVFYPGHEIIVKPGAHIIINDNSQIVQRKICLLDADGDGIPATTSLNTNPVGGGQISSVLTQLATEVANADGTCPGAPAWKLRGDFATLAYVDTNDSVANGTTPQYTADARMLSLGFTINGVTDANAAQGDIVVNQDKNLILSSGGTGGKLGIGLTSGDTPTGMIQVKSNDVASIFQSTSATNKRSQFFFLDSTGTQTARFGNDISGANSSLLQFVAGSGSTPQITINSSGQLGIGITNPAYALDVTGNMAFNGSYGIYSKYNSDYILFDHNNGNVSLSGAGGGLYIGYHNTSKNYLQADTELKNALGLYGRNAANTADVRITTVDANDNIRIGSGANSSSTDINFDIASANGGNVMIIKGSSGEVGIGNTAPGYTLDVTGTGIRSTVLGPTLIMRNSTSLHQWEWYTGGSVGNDSLGLYDRTNSAYRLSMNNSGYFGIGTTNADATLEVNGTTHLTGGTTTINDGRGDVYLEDNAYDDADGAGITVRTATNPTNGSIFSVRSSGHAGRLWVGQNFTSSGYNDFYVGSSSSTDNTSTSTYAVKLARSGDSYINGGDLGIGVTTGITNVLQVQNSTFASQMIKTNTQGNGVGLYLYDGVDGSGWEYVTGGTAGTNIMDIYNYDGYAINLWPYATAGYKMTVDNTGITLAENTPYLKSGGSYYIVPSGMYISGGTFYAANEVKLRNGIQNDSSNYSGNVYINDGFQTSTNIYAGGYVRNNTYGYTSGDRSHVFVALGEYWNGSALVDADTSYTAPRLQLQGGTGNAYSASNIYFCASQYNNGTSGECVMHMRFGGTGTYFKYGVQTTTADLAEYYPVSKSDNQLSSGDIISADTADDQTISITPATSPNRIIGIVSTKPGFVLGDPTQPLNYDGIGDDPNDNLPPTTQKMVSLSGRVPVKVIVSNSNMTIHKGDMIVASTKISGYGEKATKEGFVVAQALESTRWNSSICPAVNSVDTITWPKDDTGQNLAKPCFTLPNGDLVGKIMAFSEITWYEPNIFLSDDSVFNLTKTSSGYQITNTSTGNIITKIDAFNKLVSANIKVGSLSAKEINTDALMVNGVGVDAKYISDQLYQLKQENQQLVEENKQLKARLDEIDQKLKKLGL